MDLKQTFGDLKDTTSVILGLVRAASPEKRLRGRALGDLGPIAPREKFFESISADRVQRYRELCGFIDDGYLPVTYPHVLGLPLQIAILNDPAFPAPMLGAVHVRNTIRQERRIEVDEPLTLRGAMTGHSTVKRGYEYELSVEAFSGDERVWSEVITFMVLADTDSRKRGVAGPAAPDKVADRELVHLAAGLGRAYARVSWDFNPIHLSRHSAKLFGFERPIAHGMWTFARAVSGLEAIDGRDEVSLEVSFRRPVELPCDVEFRTGAFENGVAHFAAVRPSDGKCFLTGLAR